MSREIPKLQDADALTHCGRQHPLQRNRKLCGSPARSKTLACRETSCRKLRDPVFSRGDAITGGTQGEV